METLSQFYIEKSKIELREDEKRKEQSIKHFYEWTSKHPFITHCDIEISQILPFLRSKKYQMDKVYESFNKTLILFKTFPQLCNFQDLTGLLDLYDLGLCLVMKERDKDGRRVLIFRHKIFEENNISFSNWLCLCTLVMSAVILESETQISGIIFINDLSDVSAKYMSMIQFDILTKITSLATFLPLRIYQSNIVGLPSIANAAIEMVKSFMSEKIKNRLNILKNFQDLKKVLDVAILPVEYGGNARIQDCLSSFREKVKETGQKSLNYYDNIQVNEEMMRKYENEKYNNAVGNFRKLEID